MRVANLWKEENIKAILYLIQNCFKHGNPSYMKLNWMSFISYNLINNEQSKSIELNIADRAYASN